MRITAIDESVNPPVRTIIADDDAKRILSPLRISHAFASELQQGTEWDEVVPVDRVNVQTALDFTVDTECESIVDAEIALLDLASETPRVARIELESTTDTARKVRYLTSAVIHIASIQHHGVALQITYQITGGAILTA